MTCLSRQSGIERLLSANSSVWISRKDPKATYAHSICLPVSSHSIAEFKSEVQHRKATAWKGAALDLAAERQVTRHFNASVIPALTRTDNAWVVMADAVPSVPV